MKQMLLQFRIDRDALRRYFIEHDFFNEADVRKYDEFWTELQQMPSELADYQVILWLETIVQNVWFFTADDTLETYKSEYGISDDEWREAVVADIYQNCVYSFVQVVE